MNRQPQLFPMLNSLAHSDWPIDSLSHNDRLSTYRRVWTNHYCRQFGDRAFLDSRIKCNMIEIIRRCLVEKLLRGLKVKTFSWPCVQQPRDVVQADLAHT